MLGERKAGLRSEGRRMTVADLVILAAALLFGAWMVRAWSSQDIEPWWYTEDGWATAASLVALNLSGALLFIRLMRPRPPLARICRQPGFQASLAVCVRLLLEVFSRFGLAWREGDVPAFVVFFNIASRTLDLVGPVVATVWVALELSGRWRPEQSWIDRAGRLLGCAWIILYIIVKLYNYIIYKTL